LLRQYYSPQDIDAFAAYCPAVDKCYFLPIEAFANRIAIQLRLKPTKNNRTSESTGPRSTNSPLH
jgi:PD-(D/E)XK nuclease superfamily protein